MSVWGNEARTRVPRIAEAAVERARLTVVPRVPRSRAARMPFVVLVSLLLVGGVAGLLCFNTSMQQSSFQVTALEDEATALDAQEQSLTLELGALRDPQRVAQRAKRLGMVPPASPAFLRLSDGKVLGDATPAAPGDGVRLTPYPTVKPANLRPKPIDIEMDPKPVEATRGSAHPGTEGGASGPADATGPGTNSHHGEQGSQR
ncbi:MAG: septum formation initiator family protein [Nocardioidaceae bacterium]|nr:septum formation initiator family protein [Nocardioidaceae bacterium]